MIGQARIKPVLYRLGCYQKGGRVGVFRGQQPFPPPPNRLRLILVALLVLFSFVLDAYEPVPGIDHPNNCPRRVDAGGIGAGIARRIEGRNGPIGSTQEAPSNAVRVLAPSRDLPFRIDTCWGGRGIGIECCECAVASAQEAVAIALRVKVITCDLPCPIDAYGARGVGGAGGGGRSDGAC